MAPTLITFVHDVGPARERTVVAAEGLEAFSGARTPVAGRL